MCAGFIYGLTGDNWETYFETCLQDTPEFEATVCTAVEDLATKNNQLMIEGLGIIISQMPILNGFFQGCPDASVDINITANWYKYWANQGTLKTYSTAYRNIRNHGAEIGTDWSQI